LQPDAEVLEPGRELSDLTLRDCLKRFPSVSLRVTGDCMRPDPLPGSTVQLVSAVRRPPRLGDVVLVRLPTGLRLHRLVWGPPLAPRRSRWRTKGDRSWLWDPALDPGLVLGTVIGEGKGRRKGVWRALLSLLSGFWARLLLFRADLGRP